MKNDKDKKELEIPSLYDYFYYDFSVLKTLFDLDQIEEYASSELNMSFKNNLRGASYLFELILINIINHLELLIQNDNIGDIIQWSDTDIKEEAIRSLMDLDPIIKYIFNFNSVRKELAKIRTKNKPLIDKDVTEFISTVQKFKLMLEETNKFLIQNLGIEKFDDSMGEQPLILNWFLIKYNYMEGNCEDFFNWKEENVICSYPGGVPFFYTMPDETRKSYYLQNPVIKNYNIEYFTGYKIMLLYFYKKYLSEEHYSKAKQIILNANTWYDIHKAYGKINKFKEISAVQFRQIFKETKKRIIKEIVSGTNLKSKYELDWIFRRIKNLRMRVIRSDSQLGEYNTENLFYHVLFGAKYIQGKNIEVLEFKQVYSNDRIEFSYAIFMPMSTFFSDASYWLFFDGLALASNKDGYKSESKFRIEYYFKLLSKLSIYKFKSYEIEGNLLKDYICNKDFQESKISKLNEQTKISKGLLGQFIAYLFLAKKYDAKLIDISKNIDSTDIDVIAENNDFLFLVEAKTNFPFTNKSLEYLTAHFKDIEKSIQQKKKVRKVLFLINENTDADDDFLYVNENNLDTLSQEDIKDRMINVKNQFNSEGIEIYSYKDLMKIISSKEYTDFISKVNKAIL
ncbi:MAG: hypothetical protein NTV63_00845 [Candidatus Woesearchaeota archaeon]|nr:hypothetical protein [Candidatus Woesearchaeota archaeon]